MFTLTSCEQKHERKAAYYEKKRKERLDPAEAHQIALQERDAELVDLDAAAREWATELAKAKEDRARIAAVLSGSELQHSDIQTAARAGPVMVSLDMAGQVQGTLDKISASFPPDLATLFVHAINTCYVPPSCPPAAAPAAALPDDPAATTTSSATARGLPAAHLAPLLALAGGAIS